MPRLVGITRDMFQSSQSVRRGSERSERHPCPSLHSLRTINPPTSRMPRIVESREQLTQARPCGNGKTPPWGNPCRRELYNTPQKFMPKILDLSTVVHKLKQPFIRQNMLEHIIKYLRWNSTNMCSCGECSTDCCSISNACSEYFCI